MKSRKTLEKENKRLRKTLEAYANIDNWVFYDGWHPSNELYDPKGKDKLVEAEIGETNEDIGPWTYAKSTLDEKDEK